MKLLIADDHDLFRDGLKHLLLRLDTELRITEAGGYDEISRLAKNQSFDLALIDLDMPGMQGLSSVSALRRQLKDCRLVVLSANQQASIADDIRKTGAYGYIPKSASTENLIAALQTVLAGDRCFITGDKQVSNHFTSDTQQVVQSKNSIRLSEREKEVLRLLAKGQPNKEIARKLNISNTTVKSHVVSIFRSLNVHNRTQAGHLANELGLL